MPLKPLTKFCCMNQITLYMWSCEQSLVALAFLWEKLPQPIFIKISPEKASFFWGGREGGIWFKFNILGLVLGMAFTFYISVANDLKSKVRKLWRLNPTFVENKGEKLVRRGYYAPCILGRGVGLILSLNLIHAFQQMLF